MSDQSVEQLSVDIEVVMQAIREQIIAERGTTTAGGGPIVNLQGKHLPPAFYGHLYQAAIDYGQLEMPMLMREQHVPAILRRWRIPLMTNLLNKVLFKLHQLVLLYVNQMAKKQSDVNLELLRAINILGEKVEQLAEATGDGKKDNE